MRQALTTPWASSQSEIASSRSATARGSMVAGVRVDVAPHPVEGDELLAA